MGFKADDENSRSLQDRSTEDVLILEVGTRSVENPGYYNGIDMFVYASGKLAVYTKRDVTPYTDILRRGPNYD